MPHLYHLVGMLLILPGMRLATARGARRVGSLAEAAG
jgi:hypothetical protein